MSMMMGNLLAAVVQSAEDGLTFRDVIADIPHDVPALVVYAMLMGSGWLIWKANRGKKA